MEKSTKKEKKKKPTRSPGAAQGKPWGPRSDISVPQQPTRKPRAHWSLEHSSISTLGEMAPPPGMALGGSEYRLHLGPLGGDVLPAWDQWWQLVGTWRAATCRPRTSQVSLKATAVWESGGGEASGSHSCCLNCPVSRLGSTQI